MDRIVSDDSAADLVRQASSETPEPESGAAKTAAERQEALDRQIDALNAFHAEHGLLSDDMDLY